MLYLNVSKELGDPLIRQIYQQIRSKILDGELKGAEKLSSTRELAQVLNVSRNTVMTAYDMLLAEGYIKSVPGSGLYVNQGVLYVKPSEGISDYSVTAYSSKALASDTIGFHSGTPALDLFPRGKWCKTVAMAFKEAPDSALGYDYPHGRPELRDTLAAYLKKSRGVNCHPEQIIVTTGAKQGLTLAAKCLLKPGSMALLEDPSNENVRRIFSYHTDNIVPIEADNEGIRTDLLPGDASPALIFVTPSHQFPMGGTLSIRRRLELVRYARRTGCYIVEDDYDSEFRYRGLPVSSLQELDGGRVIYVGTFSKILFPSVRMGYIVLPEALVEECRELKRLGDHHTDSVSQLALRSFIENGDLERHITRMKKVYHKRRDVLTNCLKEAFHGRVRISGEAAGMHVVAGFDRVEFDPALMRAIEGAGLNLIPVEEHSVVKGRHRGQVILGYAHLSPEEIQEGVRRLRAVISSAIA